MKWAKMVMLTLVSQTMQKMIKMSVVLLVVIFLAGCGEQPISQTQPKTPEPVVVLPETSQPIAEWQIYKNRKYGYSVMFPVNWYSYVSDPADVFFQPNKEEAGDETVPHVGALEIKVEPINSKLTLTKIVKDKLDKASIAYTQQELFFIGGEEGLRVEPILDCSDCQEPEWFVMKNGYLYHFNSNFGYSSEFDKMVSSFRFTDSVSVLEGVKIEEIDRRKGEECVVSGPDERYRDLPLSNETYLYTDPFKSITLEMPYNKNWKFAGCEIGPFTQFKDGDGVLVYFGQPDSWGPDQYSLRIGKARSVDDIQKELLTGPEDSSLPRSQMKKITINGLDAFRWQENGMGEMAKIEVVGKSYNYEFESGIRGERELINIIKTLKFL